MESIDPHRRWLPGERPEEDELWTCMISAANPLRKPSTPAVLLLWFSANHLTLVHDFSIRCRPRPQPFPACTGLLMTDTPTNHGYNASAPPHPGVKDFKEYVDNVDNRLGVHEHNSLDGDGKTPKIVCKPALKRYWKRDRIKQPLDLDKNFDLNAESIESEYLVVFSILCHISFSHSISWFVRKEYTDAKLPLLWSDAQLDALTDDTDLKENVLKRFRERQWMFNPLTFDAVIHQRDLPAQRILPVHATAKLTEGSDSIVFKAQMHPCCGKLRDTLKSDEIVFKIMGPRARELWVKEVAVYNALANASHDRLIPSDDTAIPENAIVSSPFDYILRYCGSFTQPMSDTDKRFLPASDDPSGNPAGDNHLNRTYTILLEYAPGGDLDKLLDEMSTEKHELDESVFWNHMIDLVQGLGFLHSINGFVSPIGV